MGFINVEIKAHCKNHEAVAEILASHNAYFKGTDHQVDTYFNVSRGRLKLREGNIENSLIHYERENSSKPKTSNVLLYEVNHDKNLKEILVKSLGILTVVEKKRKIYFIDNVKFHLDELDKLGNFVEIEAIDKTNTKDKNSLKKQCEFYMKLLAIEDGDLIKDSYSDLLLNNNRIGP